MHVRSNLAALQVIDSLLIGYGILGNAIDVSGCGVSENLNAVDSQFAVGISLFHAFCLRGVVAAVDIYVGFFCHVIGERHFQLAL